MNLTDAFSYWVTENGYRIIQTLFSRKIHDGKNKYAQTNLLEPNSLKQLKEAENAIKVLQESMRPGEKREVYYRGDNEFIPQTHIREGFFPVTKDAEKAAEYGPVYKVVLDKHVPRIYNDAEGGETLLMNGMKYSFDNNTIYVTVPSPSNSDIPYLGDLYSSKKMAKQAQESIEINTIVNDLYCYSFEEPDEFGIYVGNCEESIQHEFEILPFDERIRKLRQRLHAMPNREAFLESMPFILGVEMSKIEGIVKEVMSGGRKRRTTRKHRRTWKGRKLSKN